MDTRIGGEGARDTRPRRPVRNKRYSRRSYGEDKRPPKRLFTPEIKKFLKDWLVRRRENPYPNRDEKKTLAVQTGLTYIQVCNWFANWRRKLKNAGKEPQRKTWGDLIKSYNNQVQGNVEHFSICSDDSIWEHRYHQQDDTSSNFEYENPQDHNYIHQTNVSSIINNNNHSDSIQNYLVSSTTTENTERVDGPFFINKYKNHIMEKYLKDCQKPSGEGGDPTKPSMISKWLESAANFRPNENSYLHWTFQKTLKKKKKTTFQVHGREELDAAEALTRLANSRNFK